MKLLRVLHAICDKNSAVQDQAELISLEEYGSLAVRIFKILKNFLL